MRMIPPVTPRKTRSKSTARPGWIGMSRIGRDTDRGDRDRDGDHRADAREDAAGKGPPRLPCLGGEVRDGLEARVRERREREREEERVPGRSGAEVEPARQPVGREEEREAENDEDEVRGERQHGDELRSEEHTSEL